VGNLKTYKMIGIYHNRDLDGFTSGAIIKLKYPDAKMMGYDYGQPFEQEVTGEPIIMADVSLPMKTMVKIAQLSNWQLTWIDHHISAINDYKEFVGDGESFCNAILENGIAACEGTWKHLFPEKQMPLAVLLLGEYDTWRNADKQRWENEILPFQFGMRLYCNSVDSFPIELFENEDLVKQIINEGLTVLKYQSQVNELQCKKASFETEFNGLHAICLNGGGFNSDVFKSVYDESKHDIMMPFQFDGKKWTISLYTTKDEVDCSLIAKANGGGGHKKAAGFQVEDISKIFSKIQIA
jgi:oligoribonuclease NrnB/cAMP/cGMP phosphodiesterase (DHH superfamily)